LHHYHDTYQSFPAGGNVSYSYVTNTGKDGLSVYVPLLPFIEQGNVYSQVNCVGWSTPPKGPTPMAGPSFLPFEARLVPIIICPSAPFVGADHIDGTTYDQSYNPVLGASGISLFTGKPYGLEGDVGYGQFATTGILCIDHRHRISDVTDGTSNT